uniref:Rap guanine nucleotide exchange factor 3 n=1 Tax=Macaca nemestrina TaxID=9545 RepID=A0A2K6ARB1_MACNE
MVLRKMHRPRSCSYQLLLEHQRPSCIQGLRWTPLTNSEESLDFSESLEQASTERVLRAGRQLHRQLLATCPNLIRDRKYHLRLYRQCCSGRELVDGILALGLGVHSRSQVVGICQVLLDEGALCHVKHDWAFQDRDAQFYRFPGPEPEPVGAHEMEEELAEAVALLSQRGPDALLTVALRKPPGQRTDEELDLIFEELLHIKAVAHLSNSVKRELAAVLLFEPHSKAGTVLFSQGDKGTSWYIIWKGSVNVVTHGKGLVTTLHEGDDFGQLALVNDAPRAATIILREDNCHFLRVDKQDFNRIIKVLLSRDQSRGPCHRLAVSARYTVMSGTPEKILELLLEAMGPDSSAHDPTGKGKRQPACFLTHWVVHPAGGSEQERSTYICNKRQQILRLVSQWVALYGSMLHTDPVATSFLQKLSDLVGRDARLSNLLREQWPERRRHHRAYALESSTWLQIQDEPLPGSSCAIRVGDKDAIGLQPDARGVATSLGLNERLFVVNPQEVHELTPHPDQLGPTVGSAEGLDLVSAKDLAGQLTDHDWSLFNGIHQVELIYYVLGPQHLRDVTTANLERFMRRFNELQYWVATELCLCPVPGPRAQLLRKFIKLAAHNSAISRLAHTWERLPHKVRKLYSALERLLDPSWNHRVYRLALAKLSPPVIPFMPLLLKDMTFIHEGNHTLVENLINFEKMRMMARAARMLHHCRSHNPVPLSPLRSRVSHLHEDSQVARISTCSEQSLESRGSPAAPGPYVRQPEGHRQPAGLSRPLPE